MYIYIKKIKEKNKYIQATMQNMVTSGHQDKLVFIN